MSYWLIFSGILRVWFLSNLALFYVVYDYILLKVAVCCLKLAHTPFRLLFIGYCSQVNEISACYLLHSS